LFIGTTETLGSFPEDDVGVAEEDKKEHIWHCRRHGRLIIMGNGNGPRVTLRYRFEGATK